MSIKLRTLASRQGFLRKIRAIAKPVLLVGALVATFALSSVSDVAGRVRFGDPPTGKE